jgi:ankyrin repeat protein
VRTLLRERAAVNVRDRKGRTALAIAVDKKRDKIAELLRKAGARD